MSLLVLKRFVLGKRGKNMKTVSLNTTVKEIIRNAKTKEVCNSVSNNLFENPMLVQAETMTLARIAELLGENGLQRITVLVERANAILCTLPDESTMDSSVFEINNSKGLEATRTDEERKSKIEKHDCVKPGQVWYDTEGKRIQAHGACIFFENGKYYWIGENKDHTTKEGEIWTWGVKIYASEDLYNWTDEGYLIEPELENTDSIFYPVRRLDRPHILYNEKTKKYVLWLKYCDNAHFTVLTADSLKGKFQIVREIYRPFDTNCGDFDLAKDEKTGQGYLYWEVNHTDVWGVRLSEDYTCVAGAYSVIYADKRPPFAREAVTHLERGGKHYIFTSGMTGYVPNPSEVAVSDDWLQGYKILGNPYVNDKDMASFNSQQSCIFKINGQDKYIAVADRWVPDFKMTADKYDIIVRAISSREDKSVNVTAEEKSMLATMPMMGTANTSVANYVWLPIEFEGVMPRIKWIDKWEV